MNITKLTASALILAAVGAAGFGVRAFRAASEAGDAHASVVKRSGEVRARTAIVEKQLAQETKRAESVESDNTALAHAVRTAQAALTEPVAPPAPALTREAFDARVRSAVAKASEGEAGLALSELLRSWELGKARPGGLEPGHSTQLLGAFVRLGERYPEALAALREKMTTARGRVLGNPDDTEPIGELAAIARALKDEQTLVELYDAIPAGDARRRIVAIFGAEDFIAAKRYSDVLVGRSYGAISSSFEMSIRQPPLSGATPERAEKIKVMLQRHAVTSAAKNIEVLAGAGDLRHARELAGRVLALDGSEATRALVQKHLERAGQAGLLTPEAGK
jgi:hypothetical protein